MLRVFNLLNEPSLLSSDCYSLVKHDHYYTLLLQKNRNIHILTYKYFSRQELYQPVLATAAGLEAPGAADGDVVIARRRAPARLAGATHAALDEPRAVTTRHFFFIFLFKKVSFKTVFVCVFLYRLFLACLVHIHKTLLKGIPF